MSARCGTWTKVADHKTVCMRPWDHDGPCRPERSELMRFTEYHNAQSAAITDWITKADEQRDLWPHEGPTRPVTTQPGPS